MVDCGRLTELEKLGERDVFGTGCRRSKRQHEAGSNAIGSKFYKFYLAGK